MQNALEGEKPLLYDLPTSVLLTMNLDCNELHLSVSAALTIIDKCIYILQNSKFLPRVGLNIRVKRCTAVLCDSKSNCT